MRKERAQLVNGWIGSLALHMGRRVRFVDERESTFGVAVVGTLRPHLGSRVVVSAEYGHSTILAPLTPLRINRHTSPPTITAIHVSEARRRGIVRDACELMTLLESA